MNSEDRIPTPAAYPRPRAPAFVLRSQVGRAAHRARDHPVLVSRGRGSQILTKGFSGPSFECPFAPRTKAEPTCATYPVVQCISGAFVFGKATSCCEFGCKAACTRTCTAADAAEGTESEEEEREGGGECRGRWGVVGSSGVYLPPSAVEWLCADVFALHRFAFTPCRSIPFALTLSENRSSPMTTPASSPPSPLSSSSPLQRLPSSARVRSPTVLCVALL